MATKPYRQINEILREFSQDLKDLVDHKSMSDLASLRQYNGGAAAIVVASRFGKGLWVNDNSKTAELKKSAVSSFVDMQDHMHLFNSRRYFRDLVSSNPLLRRALYQAGNNISEWYKDYEGLDKLKEVGFPPGETFESNRGKVSLYQKLRNEWTVTEDAYLPFCALISETASLDKVIRKKMRKQLGENYSAFLKACIHQYKVDNGRPPKRFSDMAYIAYRPFIKSVPGSRFSSVPKDTEKRRPINIEPLGNMLLQKQIGTRMKALLNRNASNDLYHGQIHHREMCQDLSYATIDFSGASDSISIELVKFLFDEISSSKGAKRLCADILSTRAQLVRLFSNTKGVEPTLANRFTDDTGEGWVHINTLSSMGNGFTFEVLTTVLLAVARTFDPTARVYGDDVIIGLDKAREFCEVCEAIGFRVNTDKSFMSHSFRESCGAFYQEGYGEILSFEVDAVESEESFNIAINKLYILGKHYMGSPFRKLREISSMCLRVRRQLLNVHPVLMRGPFRSQMTIWDDKVQRFINVVEGSFVMDDDWLFTAPKKPRFLSEAYPGYDPLEQVLRMWQLPTNYRTVPARVPVSRLASKASRDEVSVERAATYLYAGMYMPDLVRQQEDEKKYKTRWLCHAGGHLFYVDDLLFVWESLLRKVPVVRQ